MTALRDLLTDMAAEAGPYDVTDRAVRTVRRRRRLALAAPVVAAALVVAGALASLPLRPAPEEQGLAWSQAVAWLPTKLRPAESPAALPVDRGVAPVALAYGTGTARPDTLLAEDGRRYRAPGDDVVRAISPDGRWVAFAGSGRLRLRDVTGTTERDLGPQEESWIGGWSADGRWAVLRAGTPDRHITTLVDLESDRRTVLPARYPGARVCGVRDPGQVLLCAGRESSVRFDLWFVDGLTGRQLRHATVDPSTAMTARERRADWVAPRSGPGDGGLLLADGRTLVTRTAYYVADEGLNVPGDLLVVDVDDPDAAVRRYELPPTGQGRAYRNPDGSTSYGPAEIHVPAAAVEEGLLVGHLVPAGTGPSDGERTGALKLLKPDTGRLSTVTTVSAPIGTVVVRGQHEAE